MYCRPGQALSVLQEEALHLLLLLMQQYVMLLPAA
jgi:hypothetical protein